jgi:Na+/phosphate symporter
LSNPPDPDLNPSELSKVTPALKNAGRDQTTHVKPEFILRNVWLKVLLFILGIALFLLAILLMKDGAQSYSSFIRDSLDIDNPLNSLGFGWLFAYLIMSGSPVAAAALTFFDSGVIDKLSAFTMITGSRLGASFIVLFIGFIYVLRGRDRGTNLGMGLLSLVVTGSTYLIALIIGGFFLQMGILDSIHLQSNVLIHSVMDVLFNPILSVFARFFPAWSQFIIGFVIILLSFNLLDRCLPQVAIKESRFGRISRIVYQPWVMFLLGAGVTLISMSVSVSLSILVPLSNRGFIRRENVVPYIMGANVTTFIDTLFAALLMDNPAAFTIVLTSMVSIAIVSIILLTTIFHRYERAVLGLVNWVIAKNRNMLLFMLIIFAIPITLMLF